MDNKRVGRVLQEIATLLELQGDNPFKSRAYRNASLAVLALDEDVAGVARAGRLRDALGIGAALEQKITELVTTGELRYHSELRDAFPPGFMELLQVPGLGPKKIKLLYEKLGIGTVEQLEAACRENRLLSLAGFGTRTQERVLKGIDQARRHRGSFLPRFATEQANLLMVGLGLCHAVSHASIAGSLRRKAEIIRDIDVVAASDDPEKVMKHFTGLTLVDRTTGQGNKRASVVLASGIAADLRVSTAAEFPFALHYFTGSKEHNTDLRSRAKKLGLKLNEYGLFRGEELVPCADEAAIFAALGLDYIAPELREGAGEIEAAERHALPRLVEESDIRGVLHVHSTYSDGADSLEDMVQAAAELGYRYIGISDHSKSAFYAHGLSEAEIARQHEEIGRLQKRFPSIRILRGIESDILADGSLDYDTSVLDSLDFVIGSIHSRFKMAESEMTARIIRAVENRYITVLGHPTGRLLLEREGYAVDLHKVIDAAVANGVAVEINAHPNRLDLDWRVARYAAEKGAMLSVNPDAHSTRGLRDVGYGVGLARKAWLPAEQILNARDVDGFLEFSLSRRPRRTS
jgi:DNA polymerase (family 10)